MSTLMLADNQLSTNLETEVTNICKPLFENSIFKSYQINYFTYGRCFNDGSSYFLTTHQAECLHHHKQKYNLIPQIKNSFIGKKIHYLPSMNNQNESFNQSMYDSQNYFQVYSPIFLLEKSANYLDIFIFATKSKNSEIINFYYNYLETLEKFKSYFKSRASQLIKKSNENKYIAPIEMIKNCNSLYDETLSKNKYYINQQLTTSRQMLSSKFDENYVTQSEAEILRLIIKGYTGKEIAKSMSISPKTIESHLSNIKNRLNIKKKHELYEVAFEVSSI